MNPQKPQGKSADDIVKKLYLSILPLIRTWKKIFTNKNRYDTMSVCRLWMKEKIGPSPNEEPWWKISKKKLKS